MKINTMLVSLVKLASLFELIGLFLVLLAAFMLQFWLHELPCPLCLLQRFGFLAIAFGFLLNLRFGFRPSHYSVILISSVFTAFVALRQVALHVLPGTGSYGSPILGMHLYTWSFIIAVLVFISTSLILGVDHQYMEKARKKKVVEYVVHALFAILVFLLVANIVSVIFECGFAICPDNPTNSSPERDRTYSVTVTFLMMTGSLGTFS
jgi:disulfide bond formation protein DsbB